MIDTDREHLPQLNAGIHGRIDHLASAARARHHHVDTFKLRGNRLVRIVHLNWIAPADRLDKAIVPVVHYGIEGKKENSHCRNLTKPVVSG